MGMDVFIINSFHNRLCNLCVLENGGDQLNMKKRERERGAKKKEKCNMELQFFILVGRCFPLRHVSANAKLAFSFNYSQHKFLKMNIHPPDDGETNKNKIHSLILLRIVEAKWSWWRDAGETIFWFGFIDFFSSVLCVQCIFRWMRKFCQSPISNCEASHKCVIIVPLSTYLPHPTSPPNIRYVQCVNEFMNSLYGYATTAVAATDSLQCELLPMHWRHLP